MVEAGIRVWVCVNFLLIRYWTADIEAMLEQLVEAEERRDAAVKDSMRALFHSFSEQ